MCDAHADGASFDSSMRSFLIRHAFTALTLVALVLIVGIPTRLLMAWWPATIPDIASDRLALLGVVVAGATFAMAVLAGLVALVAYEASVRVPNLEVALLMSWADRDKPFVALTPMQT